MEIAFNYFFFLIRIFTYFTFLIQVFWLFLCVTFEHEASILRHLTLVCFYFLRKRFSNCSKISVGKTLRSKAPMCFKERNSRVCGNSRVETDEDCDPGLLHLNDDPCCSADCKFKSGAQCRYEAQGI